jgi:hypothetical protein
MTIDKIEGTSPFDRLPTSAAQRCFTASSAAHRPPFNAPYTPTTPNSFTNNLTVESSEDEVDEPEYLTQPEDQISESELTDSLWGQQQFDSDEWGAFTEDDGLDDFNATNEVGDLISGVPSLSEAKKDNSFESTPPQPPALTIRPRESKYDLDQPDTAFAAETPSNAALSATANVVPSSPTGSTADRFSFMMGLETQPPSSGPAKEEMDSDPGTELSDTPDHPVATPAPTPPTCAPNMPTNHVDPKPTDPTTDPLAVRSTDLVPTALPALMTMVLAARVREAHDKYNPLCTVKRYIFSVVSTTDTFDNFLFNRIMGWLLGTQETRMRNTILADQFGEIIRYNGQAETTINTFFGYQFKNTVDKKDFAGLTDVIKSLGYNSCTVEEVYQPLYEFLYKSDVCFQRRALNVDGTARSTITQALMVVALSYPFASVIRENPKLVQNTIDHLVQVMAVRDWVVNRRLPPGIRDKPIFDTNSAPNTSRSRGVWFG